MTREGRREISPPGDDCRVDRLPRFAATGTPPATVLRPRPIGPIPRGSFGTPGTPRAEPRGNAQPTARTTRRSASPFFAHPVACCDSSPRCLEQPSTRRGALPTQIFLPSALPPTVASATPCRTVRSGHIALVLAFFPAPVDSISASLCGELTVRRQTTHRTSRLAALPRTVRPPPRDPSPPRRVASRITPPPDSDPEDQATGHSRVARAPSRSGDCIAGFSPISRPAETALGGTLQ